MRKLLLAYYLFGTEYILLQEDELKLVEYGFCHLTYIGESKYGVSISEPLIAQTGFRFFEDHKKPITNRIFTFFFFKLLLILI